MNYRIATLFRVFRAIPVGVVLACVLLPLAPVSATHALVGPVRIGVLSHRGDALTRATWTPTARYLSASIPAYRFEVVPLDFE
jgi:hypothetical protein